VTVKLVVVVGGFSALSLAFGCAGGYYFAKKKFEKDFHERVDSEVAQAREFYSALNKTGSYSSPQVVAERRGLFVGPPIEETTRVLHEAVHAIQSYQGRSPANEETLDDEKSVQEDRNIFKGVVKMVTTDTRKYEDYVAARNADEPYVISSDEFMNNEMNLRQETLTYYAGDDVLADSRDEQVEDVNRLVGENNLQRFGQWSNDPRVVYVRNERVRIEFEIILSEGNFSEEVLGFGNTPTSLPSRTELGLLVPKNLYNDGEPHPWFEGKTTNVE
jgi:uncharacterized protein YneF (UPF0154 family)